MKTIYVNAIGLVAPGLEGWEKGKAVLAGQTEYEATPLEKYKPQLLPPNERRRATELVRLAFRACEDTVSNGIDPSQLATVFASSGGDYNIFDQICRTLKTLERGVSPTQFHNSVHNSAAGYWSIATKAHAASTSLSGFDATFAAGLLEAVSFVEVEGVDTLYAVFDIVPPMPLLANRKIDAPFAAGFVLSHTRTDNTLAALDIELLDSDQESAMAIEQFEAIRLGNPSARGLPLLGAIANSTAQDLFFAMPGNAVSIKVSVSPCQ